MKLPELFGVSFCTAKRRSVLSLLYTFTLIAQCTAKRAAGSAPEGAESIEVVNEHKIEDMLRENDQNLLVFFFDTASRCPTCAEALAVVEDIDDELEGTGFIEVVKTNDRHFARKMGVVTFPAVIYFRRQHPILYDGDFGSSADFLKWVRAHEEVACVALDDDDFEERTDSSSPPTGAQDWFVLFYNTKNEACNSHVAVWEAVAHKLRGLVSVGSVDIAESDDVAERFKIESDHDCPTYLLLRRGKFYKYKETSNDLKSLTAFALHKYKEQRGHRVPDPPTKIEELYEEIKEDLVDVLDEHLYLAGAGVACCVGLVLLAGLYKCIKSRRVKRE